MLTIADTPDDAASFDDDHVFDEPGEADAQQVPHDVLHGAFARIGHSCQKGSGAFRGLRRSHGTRPRWKATRTGSEGLQGCDDCGWCVEALPEYALGTW